jgi:hypothetical protein
MADDDRISVRFNRDEDDLKTAFFEVVAKEQQRDASIGEGTVAKTLIRRGLNADAERGRAASIPENELLAIRGQVNQISQSVRKLEEVMDVIRDDLATTVLVLLQHAGKLSADKAEKWVEKVFKS